jgi:single-strand DNA-binding protein
MLNNRVQLLGNSGKTTNPGYLADGTPYLTFSLATDRRWRAADGSAGKATDWHRVKAFGTHAETLIAHLTGSRRLFIEGRLETSRWTDAQGVKRETVYVRLENFEFLDRPQSQAQAPEPPVEALAAGQLPAGATVPAPATVRPAVANAGTLQNRPQAPLPATAPAPTDDADDLFAPVVG